MLGRLRQAKPLGILWACLVLALVLAASCARQQPAQPAQPAPQPAQPAQAPKPAGPLTLTIAIRGDATGLDAQANEDGNMRVATDNIYETLIGRNGQTLEFEPRLAESWRFVNPTTLELKLRRGVTFHDGSPFTADDVVFSIRRQIDPNLKSQLAGNFETIQGAEKVDDYTVRVITKAPDPALLSRLAWLPIMSSKFFSGKDYAFAQTNTMGTGPYKLVKWERGKQIELAAYENYWGKKSNVSRVIIKPIESDSSRLAALQAGDVDIAVGMQDRYIGQMPAYKVKTSLEYYLILITRFRGVFQDTRLAKAAVMAVDRNALAKGLFPQSGQPYDLLPFPPGTTGYSAAAKAPAYNLDEAKKLMQEAGYKGQKIQLVGVTGRFAKDAETSQAVGEMLRRAGFNVEVKVVSLEEWLRNALFNRERSPELTFLSHSNDLLDADRTFTTYIHSKGVGSKYTDKLDKVIEAARSEIDPQKRQQLYDQVARTIAEDPAWIPLFNVANIYGLSKRVTWEPRLDQRILFNEIQLSP